MSATQSLVARWRGAVGTLSDTLQTWPWRDTVITLHRRFREDRLGLTAGSLTFTTIIALVPLVTVMLAAFSAFPMFAGFQLALEKYFVQNLVPANIAQPVLHALTQFAVKAGQLGTAGFAALVITALALVLTIDRTLNAIWRVRRPRRFAQRLLIYWAALTLGPLIVAVSLTLTTYALSNTTRSERSISSPAELLLHTIEFVIFALGVAGFFRYVPNTHVRWRHAMAGGIFVAIGLQVAKRGLAWYVSLPGAYSSVYGAFSALPIFLLWLYLSWVIVLLGAVIAAYAPSLSMRIVDAPAAPGQRFTTALAVLSELDAARRTPSRGWPLDELAARMRADPLRIEPVVNTLMEMDWVARVEEGGAQRLVLLVDPQSTAAAALVDRLLLAPHAGAKRLREGWKLESTMLSQLLG